MLMGKGDEETKASKDEKMAKRQKIIVKKKK